MLIFFFKEGNKKILERHSRTVISVKNLLIKHTQLTKNIIDLYSDLFIQVNDVNNTLTLKILTFWI